MLFIRSNCNLAMKISKLNTPHALAKNMDGVLMGFSGVYCDVFSFRSHQMYYMFGFLFLVFLILIITCSEATILLCYFHLCAEVRSD